jgi:hypothetical protein
MRIPTIILSLVISTFLLAADDAKDHKTKMTGCLTKTTSDEYMLVDASGKKISVLGSADLEKHAMHKVTLYGTQKMENGKSVFQVDRVEHVSDTCVAPTGQ